MNVSTTNRGQQIRRHQLEVGRECDHFRATAAALPHTRGICRRQPLADLRVRTGRLLLLVKPYFTGRRAHTAAVQSTFPSDGVLKQMRVNQAIEKEEEE